MYGESPIGEHVSSLVARGFLLRTTLDRRKAPRGVNSYKAALLEPFPILTLPDSKSDPALAGLRWSDEDDRFDYLQLDFRSIQNQLQLAKSQSGRHQPGSYRQYQQHFSEELVEKKHMLPLQFACDANAGTEWGDGAELTFLVASIRTLPSLFFPDRQTGPERLLFPRVQTLQKARRTLGSSTPDTAAWGHSPDSPVWRDDDQLDERGWPKWLKRAVP